MQISQLLKLTLWVVLLQSQPAWTQPLPATSRSLYTDISLGYARAEDGVPSLAITALKQMALAGRIGLGYRVSRYVKVEGYFISMLARFSAGGRSTSTNTELLIEPLYQAVGVNAVVALPVGKCGEIFLSGGPAVLIQRARLSAPGNSVPQSLRVTNFGFCVAPGFRRTVGESWAVTFRFDFMNPFGDDRVWNGDLGAAFLGLGYQFGNRRP